MVSPIVVAVVVVLVLLFIASKGVRIVRPFEKGVIERLGRYSRTAEPGLTMIIPFFETMQKVDIREIVIDVAPQEVITNDNVGVTVDALVYYMIMDPTRVLYNVANFQVAATKLAQTNLRNVIGGMTLDETLTSRESINMQLRDILDKATDAWGVRVGRVEIKRIDPPKDVTEAMHRQMKAEREKRAIILESSGKRDAEINVAEGDKRAKILRAEGEAESMIKVAGATKEEKILVAEGQAKAIETVFNSVHVGGPTNDLLSYQYLQTLQKMADGQATKIVVPYEVGGLMGLATALGDVLRTPASELSSEEKSKKR
jgi:regulator of protease activity HflC (stomatin/prohibitin superfamily)